MYSRVIFIRTSAYATSRSTSKTGPEVTLQPFSVVTRLCQAAVLIQLPGANFAAAAAVQDDAHAGCALGHLQRAFTHGWAGGGGEDLHGQQYNLLTTEVTECPLRLTPKLNLSAPHTGKPKHIRPLGRAIIITSQSVPFCGQREREKLTTLRLPRKTTAIVIISILGKCSPAFFKRNPSFITVESAEESLLFPHSVCG